LLIVVCAPAIAVAAGVFIATAAARGGSTAVATAAAAMPDAVALNTRCPPPPLLHCWQAAAADTATTAAKLPPRFPPQDCRIVTKIEYFGTYIRYLPTNPTSPHYDTFPTNPRSYPVGSQIPNDTEFSGIRMFLLKKSLELAMHIECSCLIRLKNHF
jgi:hypothetical protein